MALDTFDTTGRLAFAGITPDLCRTLAGLWETVRPALPDILAGFYTHAIAVPALSQKIGADRDRLKNAQARHWEGLFSGRFDEGYFASARKIGEVHFRIGLEPRWYVGGYTYVLNRLTGLAIARHRLSASKAAVAVAAVNAAVLLDLEVAISVYQEALLTERARRGHRLNELLAGFETKAGAMVGQVAAAAGDMQSTAGGLSGNAERTRQQAGTVAAAAEEASVNVQTVASTAEELAASIAEIGRQVAQASQVTRKAVADAERTDQVVRTLAAGARKIDEVVTLISNIAGQTNLLALNATIEAARAGDAGKGFAVVASEVKGLAAQTARATEEIGRQIAEIQSATNQAVAAIKDIAGTIVEVNDISAAIAAAVEEQSAATQEIARGVHEAARGTGEVTATIVNVNRAALETGEAAAKMLSEADDLSKQSEMLRGEIATFLGAAKAA